MDYSQKLDRELCSKDSRLLAALEAGETILMSTIVWKFSAVNKQQKRIILVTNRNVYNITPQSTLSNLFSKVVSSLRVKRKIPHQLIHGVTISRFGYEFVLHVPEFVQCLVFHNSRDKILEVLADCCVKVLKKKMSFYLSDDLNLSNFSTTKADIKKGISRIPNHEPLLLDGRDMKEYDFGKYVNNVQTTKKQIHKCSISIDNFQILNIIGKGSLGQIYLCELLSSKQLYAIKILLKQDVITTDHLQHIKTERKLLEDFHHPNLIYLEWAFHTEERIFFVMPFVQGGDLFFHLKKEKRFKEDRVKFYAAQIVLALQYIHEKEYVYRDLKPENILIDKDGYIVLADYGLAKQIIQGQQANSFVGTPDYLAPEIISAQGHTRMVDWWTLGIILYEMLVGITPFYSENQNQMFESIQEKEPKFPTVLGISNEAKDLIQQLLKKDPKDRLGYKKGAEEIKSHTFFLTTNFKDLLERKLQSPVKPKIQNPYDTVNFDPEITKENQQFLQPLANSDKQLLSKFEDEFYYINYDPIHKRKVTTPGPGEEGKNQ